LSIFLITEYLNILQRIVRKGLKKSYYRVEENLNNKVKGHILVSRTIQRNLAKGRITDNVCRYQVYDIDSPENRKEYFTAVEYAQLLLRRFSYDITLVGKSQIVTPPFWIDMSKLFELYVFGKLKKIFIGKREIQYHVKAHRQELDYLLKPTEWTEPYVIDAKYKPRYKQGGGITMDDAREVSGYARFE